MTPLTYRVDVSILRVVLAEFLMFFIMTPLAILAWRGIGATVGKYKGSSNTFTSVVVPTIT